MVFTNLTPRTETITGASLTGSTGAINRTYTLNFPNATSSGFSIIVAGAALMEGSGNDFTVTAQVVTFLNIVDNGDAITINYFTATTFSLTTTVVTATDLEYATPLQFSAVLNMQMEVPSWDVAATPALENVGTGDDSQTVFYLDQKNVISDSYTISSGASEAAATDLTETTDYVMDTDNGKITLTGTGVTAVGTDTIFAEYKYYDRNLDLLDTYVVAILARAESQVDKTLNTTFTNGSTTNPAYSVKTEFLDSKGIYDLNYYSSERPIKDVSTTLLTTITDSATTLDVASGDGDLFPTTGTIIVGREVITYNGVSGDTLQSLTRGVNDSVAAVHTAADEIHTSVMEVSSESSGTAPTFTPLTWNSEMIAEDESGKFYIYKDQSQVDALATGSRVNITPDLPHRVRLTYFHGHDTVPVDITRLTILFAKKMLMNDNISSNMIKGKNEFQPNILNADQVEIDRIIGSYREIPIVNT